MPYRRFERQIERIERELGLPVPNTLIHRRIGPPTYLRGKGIPVTDEEVRKGDPLPYWVISFGGGMLEVWGQTLAETLETAEERVYKIPTSFGHKRE